MDENTPKQSRTVSRTAEHRTAVAQPSLLGEPSENLGSPPRDQTIRRDLQEPPAASKAHLEGVKKHRRSKKKSTKSIKLYIPDDEPDLPPFPPPPPPPPPPAPPVLAASGKKTRRKTRKGKKGKRRRTKRR